MRTDIFNGGISWLSKLDYKKVIVIAFLARLICASSYDIFVQLKGNDPLLPDSKFYSINGRYIAGLFNGYNAVFQAKVLVPGGSKSRDIFKDVVEKEDGRLPQIRSENEIFYYIIGIIYFIFGFFPLGVRIFNICISMLGVYFIFKVAKRQFGGLTANLFLLIALFLPTQFGYSITMSKDFLRMLIISFTLWVIYG